MGSISKITYLHFSLLHEHPGKWKKFCWQSKLPSRNSEERHGEPIVQSVVYSILLLRSLSSHLWELNWNKENGQLVTGEVCAITYGSEWLWQRSISERLLMFTFQYKLWQLRKTDKRKWGKWCPILVAAYISITLAFFFSFWKYTSMAGGVLNWWLNLWRDWRWESTEAVSRTTQSVMLTWIVTTWCRIYVVSI